MENNKNDHRNPEKPVTQTDPKTTASAEKVTDPKMKPLHPGDNETAKTPPAIPQNDADKINTPDQHKTDPEPMANGSKTKPDIQIEPRFSENKSNPAADGDGKTAIDHHKKETEEMKPKADPFKRTDYHQPTPDQTFAAANKENMEKHAIAVNPIPQDAAKLQEEQAADLADNSISGTDSTTDK